MTRQFPKDLPTTGGQHTRSKGDGTLKCTDAPTRHVSRLVPEKSTAVAHQISVHADESKPGAQGAKPARTSTRAAENSTGETGQKPA